MNTDLGKLGVWAGLDALSAPEAASFARQLEDWGYTALWTPEAVGRDPFTLIGYLAANTERIVLRQTLSEMAPGRFVLGLGVSHQHLVNRVRGHDYAKPLTTMRNYLEAIEKALYMGTPSDEAAPIVLAALRDKMLDLAATKAAGAHPYLVPPEHTERARKVMGPDAWLCPEQMVLLETDAGNARKIARQHLAVYVGLPNYQNNLRQFGFGDEDFADGGSDRLVDSMVAWGDEKAIAARIKAHHDAGANHVCIQAFSPDGSYTPDMRLLEALAPGR